jgi:hypothetical protein
MRPERAGGERRGGAPRGGRASQSARHASSAGRRQRLFAWRGLGWTPLGAPPPSRYARGETLRRTRRRQQYGRRSVGLTRRNRSKMQQKGNTRETRTGRSAVARANGKAISPDQESTLVVGQAECRGRGPQHDSAARSPAFRSSRQPGKESSVANRGAWCGFPP